MNETTIGLYQDLRKRTFIGMSWVLGGKISRQFLFLLRMVILGRLLNPQDFGLLGIGDLAILFLGVFTYTGFGEALVQRPKVSKGALDTAWWLSVGRLALMGLLLFLAAPWIATQFQEPAAVSILRALALIQVLSGFTSIGLTLLQRNMDFQRLFKLDLYVLTIDLITAIIAAIVWRNAWALVLGTFAATLTRVIMSYFIYPYRPRLVLDLKEARNLFSYGQWMLYSAILFFILSKGTDLVSGVIFGASALGLYQMASRFALLPTNHLGEVFLSTLFPAYSIIQGDPRRLRTAFLSVLQLSTFLIFPLSTLMAVTIGPTLPLILGPKWQGVVNLVTGLAVGGAIQALLRTGSPLFMATGRPNYQFIMDAASSAGIILCLYPLSNLLGLAGLPWAYAAGISFGLPVWWFFIRKQGHVGNRDILIAITPAILGSFLLALSIRVPLELMQIKETNINILPKLLGLVSVGLLSYVGLVLLIEKILPGYLPIKTSFNLMQRTFQKETA